MKARKVDGLEPDGALADNAERIVRVRLERARALLTETDLPLAVNSAIAVAGYALGVAAATVVLRGHRPGWYAWTSVLAVSEMALIAGVLVGWLTAGQRIPAHIGEKKREAIRRAEAVG